MGHDAIIDDDRPIDVDNSSRLRRNILINIKKVIQNIVMVGNKVNYYFHLNVVLLPKAAVDVVDD